MCLLPALATRMPGGCGCSLRVVGQTVPAPSRVHSRGCNCSGERNKRGCSGRMVGKPAAIPGLVRIASAKATLPLRLCLSFLSPHLCGDAFIDSCSHHGHLEMARMLLRRGVAMGPQPLWGWYVDRPGWYSRKICKGSTALHWAALGGNLALCRWVARRGGGNDVSPGLREGTDEEEARLVTTQDAAGRTPAAWACAAGHLDVLKVWASVANPNKHSVHVNYTVVVVA